MIRFTLALTLLVTGVSAQTTLKDAFKDAFRIGAAVNAAQFEERDTRGAALIKAQFNSITPENVLKWESVHPRPDGFNFTATDRYVEFGERNRRRHIDGRPRRRRRIDRPG